MTCVIGTGTRPAREGEARAQPWLTEVSQVGSMPVRLGLKNRLGTEGREGAVLGVVDWDGANKNGSHIG